MKFAFRNFNASVSRDNGYLLYASNFQIGKPTSFSLKNQCFQPFTLGQHIRLCLVTDYNENKVALFPSQLIPSKKVVVVEMVVSAVGKGKSSVME